MNPRIQEETPISIYDLRKEMKIIKKRDEELALRAGKVEEYINHFAILKDSDAASLEKEITDLEIPRLKDVHIKKILDLLPVSVEELKVILHGYTLTVSKENMQKVIDAVKKVAPEV